MSIHGKMGLWFNKILRYKNCLVHLITLRRVFELQTVFTCGVDASPTAWSFIFIRATFAARLPDLAPPRPGYKLHTHTRFSHRTLTLSNPNCLLKTIHY